MAVSVVFLWVSVGCGDDSGSSPASTDTPADGSVDVPLDLSADLSEDGLEDSGPSLPALTYAPCPAATHIGGFALTLADDYTGMNGQVTDGVVPANIPEVIAEAGDCRLLQKHNLFCDPPCVPGETCGADGACIPYPENRDVGQVTVTGLAEPLTMEAKWGNHYTNPGTMVHPGYETGAEIVLVASGAELEGFTLQGYGVEALEVGGQSVAIAADAAAEVTWTPPDAASAASALRVHLELNINNHGSTAAWIACDADDTGALSLPAELVASLYAIGVSGFPSLTLTRQSVDSTDIDLGCVQLAVTSSRAIPVEVEGVTSCTKDNQCPPGQTCGADLQCHG